MDQIENVSNEFIVGQPVVVFDKDYFVATVTKVAKRYLTVEGSVRTWQFDKQTRAYRGECYGYVPRLMTVEEYEHRITWEALQAAWRDLPPLGARVPTRVLKSALEALRDCVMKEGTE